MKRTIFLIILSVLLTGCATYKFQKGAKPYDKGYVVSRDDYVIPEYTIGKDNNAPNLDLAKERFKRRRRIVEDYYKRMDCIENNFKKTFWNPVILSFKTMGGILRLPCVAISDYKYEHNPQYRQKVIAREQEQDAREQARIEKLKERLNSYVEKDLNREDASVRSK